jgi:GAF domain-containing protein
MAGMLSAMSADGEGLPRADDQAARAPFDRLARLASRLLDVPVSLVTVVEENRQAFPGQAGLPEPYASTRETPLSYSFCRHVVAAGLPLEIEDAREHDLVRDNPAVHELGVVAYLGMPLRAPDGTVLGSVCAIDHDARAWSEVDRADLEDVCASVATEVHLRLLLERERRLAIDLSDDLVRHLAAAKIELEQGGTPGAAIERIGAALRVAEVTAAAMLERVGGAAGPGPPRRRA